jgi:hypothetical protein
LVDKRTPPRRITLGGDKHYDTHQFVQDLRALQVTPHVAQHECNVSGNWEPLDKGPIALQAEWADLYFRDVKIKLLD